jgi:predicted nuclease with TOPRIM domain
VTIDERLEKLAERHEALTQTVEILTSDLRELQQVVKTLAVTTARLKTDNERLEDLVKDIAEGTARLLRVAEVHEQRISRLEDQSFHQ